VWVAHRAGRAGRGAAALVAGIIGTAAGAGIASAHLAKAGLDAAAVVAAVVLVTGIVLLVWGGAALVRAVPGWSRLLAVPVAVTLLWFVLFPLMMAVYATNLPPGPLGSATPAASGPRSCPGHPGGRAAAGDQIAFREQLGVALLHQAAGQAQCFGECPRRPYPVPGTEPAGPDRLPELVLKLSPQRDAAAAVEGEENLGRQTGPFLSHATGPYRKSSRCLPSSV
jgi:hypothetical protein